MPKLTLPEKTILIFIACLLMIQALGAFQYYLGFS